ncbi:MAG TPA: hypothetical protein VHS31_10300 [Tepidisphaeraceae bacterium]|jgi:hypothetical protein|nr:hypothetical protein [Tepidisphaeraceae bacterium]
MAKGKRSAALFEVIQAAKEKEQLRASGGGFLTPSWWFKGRAARNTAATQPAAKTQIKSSPISKSFSQPVIAPPPVVEAAEPVVEETGPTVQEPEFQETEIQEPVAMHIVDDSSEPAVEEVVDNEEPAFEEMQPEPVAQTAAATPDENEIDSASEEESPVIAAKPSRRASRDTADAAPRAVGVNVDRLHQLINLRLSFTSAAITSFGFIVVVALAVLFGKSLGRGPSPAGAQSIEEVKKGAPFPSVLNVTQGKQGGHEEPAIAVNSAPKTPQVSKTPQKEVAQPAPKQSTQVAPPAPTPPQQTAGLAPNGRRIVGMQYVWIQSYADPLDAEDAHDALVKAGIDCTVEKGLWLAPAWSCVITTRGFEHTRSNAEFDAFMKSIRDVSNSFPPDGKLRKFDPRVVGWKDQAH